MVLKAVWLTNVDSQVMNSRANLAEGLQRLAELGFNTIYPAVWQRGYTLYPSAVAQELTGAYVLPNSPFVGRDLLAEIIELAQPLAIRVIPWFEYGLMVPPQSAIARQYPELLSLDIHGNIQRIQGANGKQDPNAWLNPCRDRVRKFIIDLIADVVNRYPVAGIQLDDHFSVPVELGYDLFTQQLFQQDRCPHINWNDWRAGQLTELLTEIVSSVKSIRRDCIVSISPNPLSFSKRRYLVDWQQWAELGLIDELVLQVYRDRLDVFIGELTKPEVRAIQTKIPTLIGILAGLKTRSISSEMIKAQIDIIIVNQFGGYSCFFYETVLNQQLSPTLVSRNKAQLIDIFSG
ncbi:MAG: family 10 glycosylhydrolase [Chamaesiphon sp.]|nr:family 10 glycosylhydrolase [Chamaesiphon sp.]